MLACTNQWMSAHWKNIYLVDLFQLKCFIVQRQSSGHFLCATRARVIMPDNSHRNRTLWVTSDAVNRATVLYNFDWLIDWFDSLLPPFYLSPVCTRLSAFARLRQKIPVVSLCGPSINRHNRSEIARWKVRVLSNSIAVTTMKYKQKPIWLVDLTIKKREC